jgi:hypothetical protein
VHKFLFFFAGKSLEGIPGTDFTPDSCFFKFAERDLRDGYIQNRALSGVSSGDSIQANNPANLQGRLINHKTYLKLLKNKSC